MNYFILCVNGLIFLIFTVNTKFIAEEREVTLRMKSKKRTASLRCQQGEIIHDVQVSSYTHSRGRDRCYGLQPSVLVSSNNCFWSRRCRIQYSNREPILNTDFTNCIGRRPKHLKLRYSCIQRELVTFIHNTAEGPITAKNASSNYGLVVSHTEFPWQYSTGIEAELNLRPTNSHYQSFYMTAMSVDAEHHDLAAYKVEHSDTWTPIEEQRNINMAASHIRFGLFTDRASHGAPGFRICFYWTNEALTSENICNKVNNISYNG